RALPARHNRDLRRAPTHAHLAVPPADVTTHACKSLSATWVTKPTHAADHRLLERGRIVPPVAAHAARRALERLAKAEARGTDRDDDDAAIAESLAPGVSLHGDPAPAPSVLDDVLADLRERHG